MQKPNLILVSGTGKMGSALMKGLEKDPRYELCNFAITESGATQIDGKTIMGVTPNERSEIILDLVDKKRPFIIIDAVPATASQANAEYYSRFENLPVIMMSTGIKDFSQVKNMLVLPNACLPILAWENFLTSLEDYLFEEDYLLEIIESHQKTKVDVSGTARKFVPHFKRLGFKFEESQIVSYRDEELYRDLGIPAEYYGAHGYHQYTMSSSRYSEAYLDCCFFQEAIDAFAENPLFKKLIFKKKTSKKRGKKQQTLTWANAKKHPTFYFELRLTLEPNLTKVDVIHCVLGHQAYVDGLLDYALPFLQQHCECGLTGKIFSTQDLYTWVMQQ